ncbi:228_t:CDS:1, partial [Funneliformis geosporum]
KILHIEVNYFGIILLNSLEPLEDIKIFLILISSDMANSHNFNHLECVNNLILALKPLMNCVNQFVKDNYKNLYIKLNNLVLGLFVPKLLEFFL